MIWSEGKKNEVTFPEYLHAHKRPVGGSRLLVVHPKPAARPLSFSFEK